MLWWRLAVSQHGLLILLVPWLVLSIATLRQGRAVSIWLCALKLWLCLPILLQSAGLKRISLYGWGGNHTFSLIQTGSGSEWVRYCQAKCGSRLWSPSNVLHRMIAASFVYAWHARSLHGSRIARVFIGPLFMPLASISSMLFMPTKSRRWRRFGPRQESWINCKDNSCTCTGTGVCETHSRASAPEEARVQGRRHQRTLSAWCLLGCG